MRCKIYILTLLLILPLISWSNQGLPVGNAPKPVEFLHFPSPMHTFIWRNWPLVEAERLAQVLNTSTHNICNAAASMGLPAQKPISVENRKRIYITLIRRNWHLLSYDQLLTLLDFTPQELAHTLREDDFLFIKLGSLKPDCPPLTYSKPDEATKERCAEIKQIAEQYFNADNTAPQEDRFAFLKDISQVSPDASSKTKNRSSRFSPRYIYSYFALYGDPLMTSSEDSYPDGLFQKLSNLGVDGIWMHTVLNQLAPSDIFPEFGEGSATRLKNLRELVQRAQRYGIGIYLYMNEPRSMTADFFKGREEMRGVQEGDYYAICTSHPKVRQWLSDSLEYVFKNVPQLAGVFSITASENLSNCASHGHHLNCPHCANRSYADIIAEVNSTIEQGVHRAAPDAKVIVWDWGWRDSEALKIIQNLPKSVYYMSVSEWSKTINRGGVETSVGEYSLSVVGPGPRALKHWAAAKKAGLKTIAKVQINNTWELSAVPYLPVLDLVAEHCQNLLDRDVNGLMLSWTLGGYPSPNLELIHNFENSANANKEQALDDLAKDYFDAKGVPHARKAWTLFSRSFQEYPYNGSVVYRCPVQYGPSNLLYPKPTGYASTMVGIPYDDVNGWRGPYPADIFANQFSKISDGWIEGIKELEQAAQSALPEKQSAVLAQLRFAKTAQLHFASVANQTRFTSNRNSLMDKSKSLSDKERSDLKKAMQQIVKDEINNAAQLFNLTRQDSRIGFEASNHYYYIPVDLVEKIISCEYILKCIDDTSIYQ